MRHGVETRRARGVWLRPRGGPCEADRYHVRVLPHGEAPRHRSEAQRLSAIQGGHPQGAGGRHGAGILGDCLGEDGRHLRFRQHVQRVVRGRPVGADGDVHAGLHEVRHAAKSARELEVAARAVHHGAAGRAAPGDLFVGEPVHVHGDEALRQQPEPPEVGQGCAPLLAEVAARRALVACEAGAALLLRLMQVDVQRQAQAFAERGAFAERAVRDGVRRMQGHGPGEERLRGEALPRPFALGEIIVGARAVGPEGELNGDDAHGRADAGADHRLANGLGEPVHVVEGRHPTQDHLEHGQLGALAHKVLVAQLHLQRPDGGLQPLAQGDVVRHAAQEAHGGVGVRVHEARHQRSLREGRLRLCLELCGHLGRRQDVDDLALMDHH
mmetsp:Transcript_151693/g.467604  ORF Transcript_151693/g.467604 Transcript_151693/m.467604 type:complete len:384 (+) Transcript_151693:262-1413(+)